MWTFPSVFCYDFSSQLHHTHSRRLVAEDGKSFSSSVSCHEHHRDDKHMIKFEIEFRSFLADKAFRVHTQLRRELSANFRREFVEPWREVNETRLIN